MALSRLLMSHIKDLHKNPIDGIEIRPSDNANEVEADIIGPDHTPFFGGVFHVRLLIDKEYPASPPKGYFVTKIFHPNVSDPKGEICVNTLQKDWQPELGIRHVFMVIRCLLIEPNPESALNEEAGKLLLENYSEYCRRYDHFILSQLITIIILLYKTTQPEQLY